VDFLVMEFVHGTVLSELLRNGALPEQRVIEIGVQVAKALEEAHEQGIIHRDLKPSNILVCLYDGKPVPKVIDFGLAKAMHHSLTEQSLYTAHGMMIGTPLSSASASCCKCGAQASDSTRPTGMTLPPRLSTIPGTCM